MMRCRAARARDRDVPLGHAGSERGTDEPPRGHNLQAKASLGGAGGHVPPPAPLGSATGYNLIQILHRQEEYLTTHFDISNAFILTLLLFLEHLSPFSFACKLEYTLSK